MPSTVYALERVWRIAAHTNTKEKRRGRVLIKNKAKHATACVCEIEDLVERNRKSCQAVHDTPGNTINTIARGT